MESLIYSPLGEMDLDKTCLPATSHRAPGGRAQLGFCPGDQCHPAREAREGYRAAFASDGLEDAWMVYSLKIAQIQTKVKKGSQTQILSQTCAEATFSIAGRRII